MSRLAMEAFYSMPKSGLTSKAFKVLGFLCWRDKDGQCYPGRKLIRDSVGLSNTAVKEAIKEIRERGLIDVVQDHQTQNGIGCRYVLKINEWGTHSDPVTRSDRAKNERATGAHAVSGSGSQRVPPINKKDNEVVDKREGAPFNPTLQECLDVAKEAGIDATFVRNEFFPSMTKIGWTRNGVSITQKTLREVMAKWEIQATTKAAKQSGSVCGHTQRPFAEQPDGVVYQQAGYDCNRFGRFED